MGLSTASKKNPTGIILILLLLFLLTCLFLLVVGAFVYLGMRGSGPLAMLATETSLVENRRYKIEQRRMP